MEINETNVKLLIETVDAGLVAGIGMQIPGHMCVEAAVCYAMGLDHSDDPKCVSQVLRSLKIRINDQKWSSSEARAKGLRKLAVLQLGTNENFDEIKFSRTLALAVVNKILPLVLRKNGLESYAISCQKATNLDEAYSAATASYAAAYAAANAAAAKAAAVANAAASVSYAIAAANAVDASAHAADADAASYAAAYAAANAAASYTANTASYAVDASAASDSGDEIRFAFTEIISEILIDMNVPGVQWLPLLERQSS